MDIFNDLSLGPTPPIDEFDFILSQVSDDEIATLLNPTTISNTHEHPQRFAAPISDADVQEARKSAVPKNTAKKHYLGRESMTRLGNVPLPYMRISTRLPSPPHLQQR